VKNARGAGGQENGTSNMERRTSTNELSEDIEDPAITFNIRWNGGMILRLTGGAKDR
jgi:hypothetical protein